MLTASALRFVVVVVFVSVYLFLNVSIPVRKQQTGSHFQCSHQPKVGTGKALSFTKVYAEARVGFARICANACSISSRFSSVVLRLLLRGWSRSEIVTRNKSACQTDICYKLWLSLSMLCLC